MPKLGTGSLYREWLSGAPQACRTGADLDRGDLLPARRLRLDGWDKLVQILDGGRVLPVQVLVAQPASTPTDTTRSSGPVHTTSGEGGVGRA